MKVSQAILGASKRLSAISDTARLDAELLMAAALGISRSDMLLRHAGDPEPAGFAQLITRRLNQEPVSYILGQQDFYGRSFIVSPDVLIPRGDSETVVDAALLCLFDGGRILDCGTGSGALLLTLLAERPGAEGVGIDSSPGALKVARANAAELGLRDRAQFLQRDWRPSPHRADWRSGLGEFALIIANPPYVETGADLAPSVRDWEPGAALFAGEDGLDDYRILIPQLRGLLSAGGSAVLEIGAAQDQAVSDLARSAGFDITLQRDLADRPRSLVLRDGLKIKTLGKGPCSS